MRRLLALLVARATLILPCSVAIGLLLPDLAALLRPAITPLVWGLLTVAMIRTDWPGLRRLATQPVRVLLVFVSYVRMSDGVTWDQAIAMVSYGLTLITTLMILVERKDQACE